MHVSSHGIIFPPTAYFYLCDSILFKISITTHKMYWGRELLKKEKTYILKVEIIFIHLSIIE